MEKLNIDEEKQKLEEELEKLKERKRVLEKENVYTIKTNTAYLQNMKVDKIFEGYGDLSDWIKVKHEQAWKERFDGFVEVTFKFIIDKQKGGRNSSQPYPCELYMKKKITKKNKIILSVLFVLVIGLIIAILIILLNVKNSSVNTDFSGILRIDQYHFFLDKTCTNGGGENSCLGWTDGSGDIHIVTGRNFLDIKQTCCHEVMHNHLIQMDTDNPIAVKMAIDYQKEYQDFNMSLPQASEEKMANNYESCEEKSCNDLINILKAYK